ncbi:MAG: purine-nucleoside phosphorylase [Lachnospiraceae bacterium]|jgi:purine-nucleoside phosphorylase|nr:purine-nucleoside phosphorylase [Lachnospiraceae bacterium]
MTSVYQKLLKCKESVDNLMKKAGIGDFRPLVAVVLGSGLGDFADGISICGEIDYADIDGFPVSTVPGHDGRLILGHVGGVAVVCMKGRVHLYEGYDITDVVLPIRLMGLMGAEYLILTNASGGIGADLKAGDLMLITDHIACFVANPLTGANIDELGTRFPDMSTVYRPELNDIIRDMAAKLTIRLPEGIYVQAGGPSFESPAEIRMFKQAGASAVGMSTAIEAIAANHMGMKICGISCVCNLAAGLSPTPLTHDEVQEAANEAAPRFKQLLMEVIKEIGKQG